MMETSAFNLYENKTETRHATAAQIVNNIHRNQDTLFVIFLKNLQFSKSKKKNLKVVCRTTPQHKVRISNN